MSASPIEQLLAAVDRREIDAAVGLMAPDVRFLGVDGRRAQGPEGVREVLQSLMAELRSVSHRVTGQWHQDDTWFAEAEGTYVLRDYMELRALPRAFFVRAAPEGIIDLRAYGAHERPLSEHRTGEEGMWVGGRWIPPL